MSYRQTFSTPSRSNISPISSKINNERSSFGPTIRLISKSPDRIAQDEDDKVKILMLALQVQRLQNASKSLRCGTTQREHNELNLLRKQLSHVKLELEKSESQKFEQSERYNRVIYSQATKISEYEAQINTITRRLREAEDNADSLKETVRNLEGQLLKAKTEAEKMNMSIRYSQVERSVCKERTNQLDTLRQKIMKYESIINEQKFLINNQREALDKLRNTEYQLKQRYDYQRSQNVTTNDQLRRTIAQLKKAKTEDHETKLYQLQEQMNHLKKEVQRSEQKNKSLHEQNQHLQLKISEHKKKSYTEDQIQNKNQELFGKVDELTRALVKEKKKVQKLKQENMELKQIIFSIKNEHRERNAQNSLKVNTLTEELEEKEGQIRRLIKSGSRKQINSSRVHKSVSESTFTPRQSQRMKGSSVGLDGIMSDLMQLQDSNNRVNKLISTNSTSASKFFAYGL